MKTAIKFLLIMLVIAPFSGVWAQFEETVTPERRPDRPQERPGPDRATIDAPRHTIAEEREHRDGIALPYVHIREADIMWSQMIWRRIDMRQKINLPFYYPFQPRNGRENFMTVVRNAIERGDMVVYQSDITDDYFVEPLSIEEAISQMQDSIDVVDYDDFGNEIFTRVPIEANTQDIFELDVKEIWFFDKHRSVMDVRIIGIRPIWHKPLEGGETDITPLFWIYYPEARHSLVNAPVFNRQNEAQQLSYEDLFAKRMFASFIYKEANVYDREISDYKMGMDALLEAKDIKERIRANEMDLWEY